MSVDVLCQAIFELVEPLLTLAVNFFDRSVAAECHSGCRAMWSSTSLRTLRTAAGYSDLVKRARAHFDLTHLNDGGLRQLQELVDVSVADEGQLQPVAFLQLAGLSLHL